MLRKRSANWKLVVAIAAACIAGAAIDHSLFYVINQNKSVGQAQKQTTNESIEAGADQTIARYTVVLALFTAVLAGVGIFQGYLTAQQIRLARNEFNATHRPRIRIRQVFMPNLVFVADHLSHGDNFEISIVVANVGDSEACIINSRCRVFFYRDEAQVGQYVYRNPPLRITNEVIVLGVGESRTFTITDTAEMRPAPAPDMRIMRQFMAEKWKMLIFGEITYADKTGGNRRLTGFIRDWKPGGCFTRMNEPDLEYED